MRTKRSPVCECAPPRTMLPYHVVWTHILPRCADTDIDVRIAFKLPPRRLASSFYEVIAANIKKQIAANEVVGEDITLITLPITATKTMYISTAHMYNCDNVALPTQSYYLVDNAVPGLQLLFRR